MAVKAIDSVTVIDYTDVKNVKPWYLSVPRTSSAPTVSPTATEAQMRANGWDTTEPGVDTTTKLYIVQQCLFGDNTYVWGDVSLSSSYEAAIQAYNEAYNTSQNLADNYMTSTDTNDAISGAVLAEALARERDSLTKLDKISSNGNGYADWDEFGTLTITREIPETNEIYAVVVGANGIEFQYQGLAAASINQDRLVIDKTVVLDEMQVGNNKWTWKIDSGDNSIFLKWIG